MFIATNDADLIQGSAKNVLIKHMPILKKKNAVKLIVKSSGNNVNCNMNFGAKNIKYRRKKIKFHRSNNYIS